MSLFHHAIAVGLYASVSSCQYFSNVVIPPTDTTPPVAWAGVYSLETGSYVAEGGTDGAVGYTIGLDELTNTYLLVSAGIDGGGVSQVEMTPEVLVWCDLRGAPVTIALATQVVTQAGNVGDTVSNGQWTYTPIRFDTYLNADFQSAACGGAMPGFVEAVWSAVAVDFHGNRTQAGTSILQIVQPGNMANPDPMVSKASLSGIDGTALPRSPTE